VGERETDKHSIRGARWEWLPGRDKREKENEAVTGAWVQEINEHD
jgi:hypothetical protein